jgi:hypothetical protein
MNYLGHCTVCEPISHVLPYLLFLLYYFTMSIHAQRVHCISIGSSRFAFYYLLTFALLTDFTPLMCAQRIHGVGPSQACFTSPAGRRDSLPPPSPPPPGPRAPPPSRSDCLLPFDPLPSHSGGGEEILFLCI